MKEFRKSEEGLFICEECGNFFKNFKALGCHIIKNHKIESKDYYDKWIKETSDSKCAQCKKDTCYSNLNLGYKKFCSVKCSKNYEETKFKERRTNMKRYGVEYISQDKNKRKITQIKILLLRQVIHG